TKKLTTRDVCLPSQGNSPTREGILFCWADSPRGGRHPRLLSCGEAGDPPSDRLAAAREGWRQARSELEPFLKDQSENWSLMADLALTNMSLGDKAAAFSFVEKWKAGLPLEKDALDGPGCFEVLARVSAQLSEPDRAIAALQKALSIPYQCPFAG